LDPDDADATDGPIHANVDTEWLHVPAGTARVGDDPVVLDRERTGFIYSGLHVVLLAPGDVHELGGEGFEYAIVPIAGGDVVLRAAGSGQTLLAGRPSVFEGIPDIAAVGCDTTFELEAAREHTLVALAYAHAREQVPTQVIRAADIPVEVRGAGVATRQLNNLFAPGVGPFDRLTVVEGLVPGGNWASWPPHKHDTPGGDGGDEAVLEEIYWFQVRGEGGWAAHRTYDTEEGWDVTATIRDGDAFLVPRGYHGPEMAAPGHDLYFLNVLAGPGAQRSLAFSDDPAHAHVRQEWESMTPDPRVPLVVAR
jgi:5-deoxy-glucuronate isomerase